MILSVADELETSQSRIDAKIPPKMEDFRSKSCREGRMEIYYGGGAAPTSMQDLRCYSTNNVKDLKLKKTKSSGGGGVVGSISKSLSFNDPELQRKKRVASYKVYAVEGKMKGSLKKSFRWIKNTVVYGWW